MEIPPESIVCYAVTVTRATNHLWPPFRWAPINNEREFTTVSPFPTCITNRIHASATNIWHVMQ